MALVRLDWTREEVILAMDFYISVGADQGGPIPGQSSRDVVQLSALLKKLGAYPLSPGIPGEDVGAARRRCR
jgi:hypothetical protein